MHSERTDDVERGLRLIPALGEVMPEEANEKTRGVYDDVRKKLRVPFVNFIFRVLANYPRYLSFAWDRIGPHLLTADFEEAADGLRVRALLEEIPRMPEIELSGASDLSKIRDFTDTIHYVLPKLALVVGALDEGLGGEAGAGSFSRKVAVPDGVAEGTLGLPMVSREEADPETKKLFEEIRARHGHPGLASYYRAIGHWPRFLGPVWESLNPLVGSTPYEERKHDLLESARSTVLDMSLPGRAEVAGLGISGDQIDELRAILAVFRFRVVPDTFVEVAAIKAMLDGREAALASRFSFTAR